MAKGAKYQNRHEFLQRPEMLIPRGLQGETMHELPQRTPEVLIARGLRGEATQLRGGSGRGLRLMQAIGEAMEPGTQA